MEINKLQQGNIVKYNNIYSTILKPLNYNQFLINHNNKPIVVNILNLKVVEINTDELIKLGFEKEGESFKRSYSIWQKEVITNVKRLEIPEKEKLSTLENVLLECEKGSDEYKHITSLIKVAKNKQVDYKHLQYLRINFSEFSDELSLEDITGVESFIPEEYKYVHQLQNLLLYVEN